MSTRALQDSMMLLGYRDPTTDEWLASGTVEFYSAGTLNAKNAWEDKDKASAITSVTLDSSGQAQVYLDGVYKFIVKNAAGTTRYTLDNLKFQARNTSTVEKTANYQATADDDYILGKTDGGTFTITLPPVSTAVAPITIKNTGSSSTVLTIDGSDSETIDGVASQTLADGGSQQYVTDGVQWYGAGVSTGIAYTSTSLLFGTTITATVGGSSTSLEATGVEATDGTLVLSGGTDGTDATFTGDVTGDVTGALTGNADTATLATTATNVTSASQAEQEAATSTEKAVTPSVQQSHPSACKAWGDITGTTVSAGYNISSVSGTTTKTVNWAVDFSSADYAVTITPYVGSAAVTGVNITSQLAGSISFTFYTYDASTLDSGVTLPFYITAFGDQ